MSDEHVPTPRTDAEAIPLNDQCVLVSYDFARTLERELAAATARAESLSAVITEITPTILNGRGGWTIGEIAPAVFALYARAEKAEAELTRYVDAVNAQPWASDLPIRKLLDEITSRLYQAESRVRHVETGFARMQEIAERAGGNLAAAEAREGNANARIAELEAERTYRISESVGFRKQIETQANTIDTKSARISELEAALREARPYVRRVAESSADPRKQDAARRSVAIDAALASQSAKERSECIVTQADQAALAERKDQP